MTVSTDERRTSHPVIKLKARGVKGLVEVELTPANLARIAGCSETSMRRAMEREGYL
jgi:hypothetical protein